MIEFNGDIWHIASEYSNKLDAICITTNGTVKKNGACVMGRGIAKQAKDRYPGIDKNLGYMILNSGNIVHNLGFVRDKSNTLIFSFPVKHHWKEKADLDLIEQSALQLVSIADELYLNKVLVPRPGCGNGNRDWETEVKPILESILDLRFAVITNE